MQGERLVLCLSPRCVCRCFLIVAVEPALGGVGGGGVVGVVGVVVVGGGGSD